MTGAFFVALGNGRFRATEHTVGPWDPGHQHAGPAAALLAGMLDTRADMALARITLEILAPIPLGEVEVAVEVERPGRSVELLAAELRAGGRTVVTARAWRVRRADERVAPAHVPPPLPATAQPSPPGFGEFGYARAVEWRWAEGGWLVPGPAKVWTKLLVQVVEGKEPTPLQRVLVVADSGNGVSAALAWNRYVFVNTELSVHLLRPPAGEWVCLEARTEVEEAGLASSVLSDLSGPVARGAQALFVARR
ncbi:thioesterase family protein [Candidatus Solirubrobacter pratensis]|uniref:thioesterase family protein n=1 Tax=Candidatus Solirubrobacter pratensis TaxID=1298857 RepID=UPI00048213EF|nr:thioesterase family protein [Candidatus Solirubrobacter pratensis]